MIFAAYFVMRGRNAHIDFLWLLPVGTDLPSDARAFSLTSYEMLSFSLRLSKGFYGCLILSKVPPGSE